MISKLKIYLLILKLKSGWWEITSNYIIFSLFFFCRSSHTYIWMWPLCFTQIKCHSHCRQYFALFFCRKHEICIRCYCKQNIHSNPQCIVYELYIMIEGGGAGVRSTTPNRIGVAVHQYVYRSMSVLCTRSRTIANENICIIYIFP